MAPSSGTDIANKAADPKALANEVRNAPPVSGALYAAWGAVVGAAAFLNWLRAAEILALPGFVGGLWFWVAALAIGCGLSFFFARNLAARPRALAIGVTTETSVWFGSGLFLLIYLLSIAALHDNFEAAGVKPYALFGTAFPVAFGIYGVALHATAIAGRIDWMRGFAAAAWIFSAASFYYFGDEKQLLVASAGSVICAVFPGLILMRLALTVDAASR